MFPRSSAFQNLELHWEHVFCLWRSKIHCKFRSLKRDPRMSLQYLFVKMHALEHKKQESQDHFAIYFFRSRCKQHGELLQTSSSTASAATTSSTTSRRETWKCVFIISKGPRYSNHSVEVKEAQDITWSTHRKLGETKPKTHTHVVQMLAIHYYAWSTRHCIVGSFFAGEDSRWRRSWWILGKESLSQHLVWPLDGDFKRLVRHFLNHR